MATLRSALFALVFYTGTIWYVVTGLIAARWRQPAMHRIVLGWALFHRGCARRLLGIRTEVTGTFPPGPVIVAAKHQSMFETVELLAMLRDPAVVLKQELADLPGWGALARAQGVIPVDRAGSAAALKRMLRAARAAVAQGRAILIFPEGTRVAVGETPPLRAGFAGLYKALALPVVPVALDSGRLWPRKGAKRRGTIRVVIGETIPPGLPREEAEARVHAAINRLEGRPDQL